MTGTEEAVKETTVSQDMVDDIEQAVNEALKDQGIDPDKEESAEEEKTEEVTKQDDGKEGEEETEKTEEPTSGETGPGEESQETPSGDVESSETDARTDELLTRAVRAGIDLKDARAIVKQDADTLERQIALVEKASRPAEKPDGEKVVKTEASKEADAVTDLLSGIPDLDPEVYDEALVDGFKTLKFIIQKQGETIRNQDAKLEKYVTGQEKKLEKSWFNAQVDGLKIKDLPEAKREALHKQFDILKAGYAAREQSVDDRTVFSQATQLVLNDEMKKSKDEHVAAKLAKREKQQTVRPNSPAVKPKGDLMEELASKIDEKYFKK